PLAHMVISQRRRFSLHSLVSTRKKDLNPKTILSGMFALRWTRTSLRTTYPSSRC
ncbi:hypothetical protein BGZ65_005094, partial [Modicella reniformis]